MPATRQRLALALAVSLMPACAAAAVLGDVIALSPIGQPLRIEIAVNEGQAASLAGCLQLAPGAASEGPWVEHARIAAGPRGIVVSTSQPAFEPILRLAVADTCTTRLRREYTLLLPFAEVRQAVASPPPSTTAAAPLPAPPARGMQRWTTAPGESLSELAQMLYPREAAVRQRFIAETVRANPALFADADAANRALPPGTELLVPDLARLSASAPPSAPRPAPPAAAPTERPAPPATRAAAQPAPAADRLRLEAESVTGPATAAAPPLVRGAVEDLAAREQYLVTAIDRSIQAQLDLVERIRELERIQAELIERANRLGIVPADGSAVPATAPAPTVTAAIAPPPPPPVADDDAVRAAQRPVAASSNDWLVFLLLFAAIVTLILALKRWQAARRERVDAALAAALPETPETRGWPQDAQAGGALDSNREDYGISTQVAESQNPDYKWSAPSLMPSHTSLAPIVTESEAIDEHDSAVELAEIMMSFGRVQGAAETLADFIRGNPKQAVKPWLKLLEVYRAAGMRPEFDGLARQLNKTFNVHVVSWEAWEVAHTAPDCLEALPHIADELQRLWGTEACQAYIEHLLRDNRDGTRTGFPLRVVDDLLMLAAVLEQELGRYRPELPGGDLAATQLNPSFDLAPR